VTGSGTTDGRAFMVADSNNSPKIVVLDSGNVGIGTTAPGAKLTVDGATGVLVHDGTYTEYGSNLAYNQSSTTNTYLYNSYAGSTVSAIKLGFGTSLGSNVVATFQQSGNVGIGTTAPNQTLDVYGIVQAQGYITTSDRDLKENIQEVSASTHFKPLKAYSYRYKHNVPGGENLEDGQEAYKTGVEVDGVEGRVALGFMQDEVPEVCRVGNGIDYGCLTVILWGKIAELQEKLDGGGIGRGGFSSGNVGIGTTSPNYQLELSLDSAGKPGAGGLWTVVSDERIKENINNLTNAIDKINLLRPVSFDFIEDYRNLHELEDSTYTGFIAQEYETVFPDAVNIKGDIEKVSKPAVTDENGTIITPEEKEVIVKDAKDVNAGDLIPYLIKAVQEIFIWDTEQDKRIEGLEKENEELKQRLEILESKL
ncbi:tail fiber domain-containing protein, partial [Patescibacteria group bacterium]|nr:tail fiber domain-containing protein [Patescibacteria group bacterium]